MKRFAFGLLALVLSAGTLLASDLTPRTKAQPQATYVAYNWSGFYAVINAGAGIGQSGATSSPASVLVPNDPADRMKGWLAGGGVGVRQQVGAWVFGLEADIDWANITNRSTSGQTTRRTFLATQLADTNTSQTNGAKLDWLSMVRGSVGFTPWERVLVSLTGGVAFGKVNWDNSQNVSTTTLSPTGVAFCNAAVISCPNGAASATDSKVLTGWTLGTVVDVALARNWTLGGEVFYVGLGSAGGTTGTQKFDMWATRGRLSYRF